MKKLLLLFLAIATGIVNANAAEDMWLRSDLNGGSWTENKDAFKFSVDWDASTSQDVYVLTIDGTKLNANTDFYFRLYRNGNNYETCPYGNQNYTYQFNNGQYETYDATSEETFHGTNGSFCVAHSSIKANSYKITVYVSYGTPWHYYIKVDIVDMPVTVGASGFATLVSDRALDFTETGITAYTAEDAGSGNATLISVDKPKAKTPMLLKASEGNYIVPVILNSNPNPDFGETIEATDNPTNNAFKAGQGTTVASVEDNYKNYILNSGTFYLANDQMVATNKAYLQLGASNTSKANLIFPNGDATSISSIMGEGESTNVYYNLQGMQVSNPTKGMYLVNGKKIMVK